jgi:hypothetical protein
MYIAKLDVRGPHMFGDLDDVFRAILDTTATEADSAAAEDNFISGCYALASARAEILRSGVVYPIDAEFAFSLWCRWPLKPDLSAEFRDTVRNLRESIFTEDRLNTDLLVAAVPDATLLLPFEGLYRLQAAEAFNELFQADALSLDFEADQ